MKTHVKWRYSFTHSEPDSRGRWAIIITPRPLYFRGKNPDTPLIGGWVDHSTQPNTRTSYIIGRCKHICKGAGIVQCCSAGLWPGRSGVRIQAGLGIFLFTTTSRPPLWPTQLPIQWVPDALSLKVKRPESEADHSPPSSVEVKNAWSYISTPPIHLMASCSVRRSRTALPLHLHLHVSVTSYNTQFTFIATIEQTKLFRRAMISLIISFSPIRVE
jgi:hypothetical protein